MIIMDKNVFHNRTSGKRCCFKDNLYSWTCPILIMFVLQSSIKCMIFRVPLTYKFVLITIHSLHSISVFKETTKRMYLNEEKQEFWLRKLKENNSGNQKKKYFDWKNKTFVIVMMIKVLIILLLTLESN